MSFLLTVYDASNTEKYITRINLLYAIYPSHNLSTLSGKLPVKVYLPPTNKCLAGDKIDDNSKRLFVSCLRPYHVESTTSRPICQVKQRWSWLVLGSETA
ncbi:unnamed protein product [Thelazia callipaeda]|uniref:PLAT domain-containing protein n=1 Tax=Thelazia callipaeda TaxID=103827 RepID=A0A0N5DBW5_THECL|nr:unnamed protein product [Thelazia callipaeda]